MSDDLVSLRLLLIAATRRDEELWRQAVAIASIPIEFASQEAEPAAGALARVGPDICVVEGSLPKPIMTTVINSARAAASKPLIFVSASAGTRHIEGIDGRLAKPSNVEDAHRLVEICIRSKVPTRVLIVDDSSTMRSIVRKILSASNFPLSIEEAEEGIAALNQLRTGKFSLVFLDYNMPGLNGFETLSEIKRNNSKVAVVMMTSTLDNAIADRAHAAGALAFLQKPFYPSDIDTVLERYYGLHALRG